MQNRQIPPDVLEKLNKGRSTQPQLPSGVEDKLNAPLASPPGMPSPNPFETAAESVPEIFPGFRQQFEGIGSGIEGLGQRYTQALTKKTQAEKKQKEALATQSLIIPNSLARFIRYEGPEPMLEDELAQAKLEFDAVADEMRGLQWRKSILVYLQVAAAKGDKSADDILARVPYENASQADIDWLRGLYETAKPYLSEPLPFKTISEKEAAVQQALQPKPLPLAAVHSLSVQQLGKYIGVRTGELPQGMTAKQVVSFMKELGLSDEQISAYNDASKIGDEIAAEWKAVSQQIADVKSGVAEAKSVTYKDLEFWQGLLYAAAEPLSPVLEGWNWFMEVTARPLGALAVTNYPAKQLTEDPYHQQIISSLISAIVPPYGAARAIGELDKNWAANIEIEASKRLSTGASLWEAYGKAYEDADGSGWSKFIVEELFDPTNYLTLFAAATKGIPVVGKIVSGLDKTFDAVTSAPFKPITWAGKKITKVIGITPGQMVYRAKEAFIMDLRSGIQRVFGNVNFQGVTKEQLEQFRDMAIKAVKANDGSQLNRIGRFMLAHKPYEEAELAEWAITLGQQAISLEPTNIKAINGWFDSFLTSRIDIDEVANNIASELNAMPSLPHMNQLKNILEVEKELIISKANQIFKAVNVEGALRSALKFADETYSQIYNSKYFTDQLVEGQITGWSKTIDRVNHWSLISWFDRHVGSPLANHYLLIANYGPMNVLETMFRGSVTGGEMFFPNYANPLDEWVAVGAGLPNFPYEYINAQNLAARAEMSIVDPQTGLPKLFDRGIIPYITASGPKGFKIKIQQYEFTVKSFQHLNDAFSTIGLQQRSWWYKNEYVKQLWKSAPDTMSSIYKIVDDRANILSTITDIPQKELQGFIRMIAEEATINPNVIRTHDFSMSALSRNKSVNDINKFLDNLHEIHSPQRNAILQAARDGTLWKDIDKFTKAIGRDIREKSIASMPAHVRNLQNLSKQWAAVQPQDAAELFAQFYALSEHISGLSNRYTQYMREIDLLGFDFHTHQQRLAWHKSGQDFGRTQLADMRNEYEYLFDIMRRQINGEDFTMNWTSVQFLHNSPDLLTSMGDVAAVDKVKRVVDILPVQLRSRISSIEFLKDISGALADYDPVTRAIRLSDEVMLQDPSSIVHELIHGVLKDSLDDGNYELLLDLYRRLYGEGTAEYNFALRALSENWDGNRFFSEERVIFYDPLKSKYDNWAALPSEQMSEGAAYHLYGSAVHTNMAQQVDAKLNAYFELHFPKNLSKVPLSDSQKQTMLQLLDLMQKDNSSLGKARLLADAYSQQMMLIKPKFGDTVSGTEWWENFSKNRDEIAWQPYFAEHLQYEKQKLELQLSLSPTPASIPKPLLNFSGDLSPAHIAYLYGLNGDDFYRSVFARGMTIQPRDHFITMTMTRANDIAKRFGVSPTKMGFDADSIGKVYDQMLYIHGINPADANDPMFKAMQELELARQEFHRLKAGRGVSQSTSDKLMQFTNEVADELDTLPIYRAKPEKWTSDWQINEVVSTINRKYKSDPSIWYHGGPSLDGGLIESGFLTKDPREAAEYAMRASRTGEPGEAFVHAVDIRTAKLDRSHVSGLTSNAELLEPVKPIASFDFMEDSNASWWKTKEAAMSETRIKGAETFTDYSSPSAVDAAMHNIFPFWKYETQRLTWLPKTLLKNPAVTSTLLRYHNYTDKGYVQVPYTDFQINPFRGTALGSMRRLMTKDYPSYYDDFPGMKMVDFCMRLGLYPGAAVTLPITILSKGRDVSDITPPWVNTAFDTILAATKLLPQNLQSQAVLSMSEQLFPSRFRDYITMLQLGARDINGVDIWRKMKRGEELTDDEAAQWTRAQQDSTGLLGAFFEQASMFRFRPPEYKKFMEDRQQLIFEMTGVSPDIQKQISKMTPYTGLRLQDLYPLDSFQQKIIREMLPYELWEGVTEPLEPASQQVMRARTREYYTSIEDISNRARFFGSEGQVPIIELNRQLVAGEINGGQWRELRGEQIKNLSNSIDDLGKLPIFRDVPKTLAERTAYALRTNSLPPLESPDEELMRIYYELKPEYRWNEDSGRREYDFDEYFAKLDALMDSMSPEYKDRVIASIQFKWTPMEKLYYKISREYLSGYRAAGNYVLKQYTPEEQAIIKRSRNASTPEREELKQFLDSKGNPILSSYQQSTTDLRTRMRLLDPELDAWLNFFGYASSFKTKSARQAYDKLVKQYLTPSSIGSRPSSS